MNPDSVVTPEVEEFLSEVLWGLSQTPKRLSCKWFYDRRGSQLFDAITELPEYYPTRTERTILCGNGAAIAHDLGANCALLELGSGSSAKTRILLDAMLAADCAPVTYVPLDISCEHLLDAAARLQNDFPALRVRPVCTDYTQTFSLPNSVVEDSTRRVAWFPGSTIGNFEPREAQKFLRQIRDLCGADGGLLIGVDLRKNPQILHEAYNDAQGITAEFNLNVLARINCELGGDFDLKCWRHRAFYNKEVGRIEMYLDSGRDQIVRIGDTEISFNTDESIGTEYSYKYTLEAFAALAARAGWQCERVWTDDDNLFSVQLFGAA